MSLALLGMAFLFGRLVDGWMGCLGDLQWWRMGKRLATWGMDRPLAAFPGTYALAYFPGALAIRNIDGDLYVRTAGFGPFWSGFHARAALHGRQVRLELRSGVAPFFSYPFVVLLPYAPLWLVLLLLFDVWMWRQFKIQIRALIEFLPHAVQ